MLDQAAFSNEVSKMRLKDLKEYLEENEQTLPPESVDAIDAAMAMLDAAISAFEAGASC